MKIGICTVGSTGDIQPYLALAVGLRAAGHQVRVISHPFHQARFEAFGLEYVACGPVVTQQQLNEMLDKMLATRNPIRQLRLLMMEAFFAEGESYFHASKAALEGCDLAICHMVDFLSSEAAAQLRLPRISGILAPAGIPTAHAVPPRMPYLGKWLNPLLWKAVGTVLNLMVDRPARAFLSRLGGPTIIPDGFHVLSRDLTLLACSPTLCPTFPDLPAYMEVTGPWILEDKPFTPSGALSDFLVHHPKPVILSFGSMGGTQGPVLTQVVLDALRIAGKPAIIQSGYSHMVASNAPSNVVFTDFVPHAWLFPQASCVIHHAGAGTSTAVARAGVPHVPVTFIADQPYFAHRLHRLGIGSKPLWYYHMRPENLAKRILQACDSPALQANAKALQPTFLAEDGTARAVARIERFMQNLKS